MCGIAGIAGNCVDGRELVQNMLHAQRHRGPDGSAIWQDNGFTLGHNRLSIIDLSSRASQPMHSACGRYTLVFNGEIYNYIELRKVLGHYWFSSESDSEVLLAAYIYWGKDCLHRLNGMFSFAIWDSHEMELFAARDRFGVKPFYYAVSGGCFYFASEIKALFAAGIPSYPNETVWASYFVYGSYGAAEETFWQGIQQLPAAHYLSFSGKLPTVTRWYSFVDEVKKYPADMDKETAMSRYLELLKDSISLRFRSDVPVGINISGGLDSSILLSLVNLYQSAEQTSSYTFYTGHPDYDETEWVDQMVLASGNPSAKVLLSADEIPGLSRQYSFNQDEPYGGIPTIAYGEIFRKARKDGVIVLLDGQGMDEQWAGYDYYWQQSEATIQGVSASPFFPAVLSESFRNKAKVPNYPKPFDEDVKNKQYRDLFYTKLPRALRFSDRMSMMYSTELREPFLDHRLVELAFSLPEEFKINGNVSKYMLRQLTAKYLPEAITFTGKRPLQTPQREWLSDELSEWASGQIHDLAEIQPQWFDREALLKEWDRFAEERPDSSFHIWQYINTKLLLE